jgi:hypothetical protein
METKAMRQIGEVSFVNFGALNGSQLGMVEQAHDLVQDRFERGVKAALKEAGVDEASDGLKVVGMREWMEDRKEGGRGILEKHIVHGWKRIK